MTTSKPHERPPCEETTPRSGSPQSVRIRGLSRSFGQKLALAPLDLDVPAGEITGLLGPNGSGKSTLMRCLLGLVRADSGEAWVDGVRLRGDGREVRARSTFAPGEFALYGQMRADRQLDWLLAGRDREAHERAHALANELELPMQEPVHAFSHGMKRQLLFAAAMGPRVAVRILDEISEGLDPAKRGLVLERLRDDVKQGTAVLLSSHHLGEVQRICDSMVFMRGGHLLSDQNTRTVLDHSRRLVRLQFAPSTDLARLEAVARAAGAVDMSGPAENLLLHLDDQDPRRALTAIFSNSDLPSPLRIEYGQPSLEELYRELYGEDAC